MPEAMVSRSPEYSIQWTSRQGDEPANRRASEREGKKPITATRQPETMRRILEAGAHDGLPLS